MKGERVAWRSEVCAVRRTMAKERRKGGAERACEVRDV